MVSAVLAAFGGMLLFYSTICAAPPAGQPPFADAVVQREEMLRELRGIRELLKEQNSLLKQLVENQHERKPGQR
jgi:hypothetical protein